MPTPSDAEVPQDQAGAMTASASDCATDSDLPVNSQIRQDAHDGSEEQQQRQAIRRTTLSDHIEGLDLLSKPLSDDGLPSTAPDSPESMSGPFSFDISETRTISTLEGLRRRLEAATSPESPAPAPTSLTTASVDALPTSTSPSYSDLVGKRLRPTMSSSLFRPGSTYRGAQTSDKSVYQVEVVLKYVDLSASFCCGFLKIEGLTDKHPTLTTYFESEVIGTKYSFHTAHPDWGTTEKTDMQHWQRFPAWQRPERSGARRRDYHDPRFADREDIFMRWKEQFLVPDHRQRDIPGASFEGFYYICFNQVEGVITGTYYHSRSERYQKLELRHVRDTGVVPALEFR